MSFLVESFGTFKYRFILSISRKTLASPIHIFPFHFFHCSDENFNLYIEWEWWKCPLHRIPDVMGKLSVFLMWYNVVSVYYIRTDCVDMCSYVVFVFVTSGLTVLISVPYVDSLFRAFVTKDLELCQRPPLHLLRWSHHFVLNIFTRRITFIDFHMLNLAHVHETTLVIVCDLFNAVWSLARKYFVEDFCVCSLGRRVYGCLLCWSLPCFGIRIGDVSRTLPFLLGNHFRSVWQLPLQSDCSYGLFIPSFGFPVCLNISFQRYFPMLF